MRRYRKLLIAIISAALIVVGCFIAILNFIVDENALTNKEKKWLNTNSANLVSIAVPNDIPVFGSGGNGVFFDFTNYLVNKYKLNINNNTVSYLTGTDGYRFEISSTYDKNKLLLFKDHYVLVSKNTGIVNDVKSVFSSKPAILKNTKDKVISYYGVSEDTFTIYDSYSNITTDLGNGTIEYAIVPLNEYKDQLIANGVNILNHISDLNRYYYFCLGNNKNMNDILTKIFKSWVSKEYKKSYNKNNYDLFITNLKITEAEEDTLTNKVYKYGFNDNKPYEVLASGEYGGITSVYLREFTDFSGVDFTFKKYKSPSDLATAAVRGEIDLYYNYYDLLTNYIDAGALEEIDYYVIADNSIDLSLSNVSGLANQTVYVLKDSYLYDLIKNIDGINIITYEKPTELKRIIKKSSILLVDEYTYDYYVNKITNNYSVRLKGYLENNQYTFRYRNNSDTFYKLFNAYTKTLDPSDVLRNGIITYNSVNTKGEILGNIAKYLLVLITVGLLLFVVYKKSSKKVKINTKVKKEDRLKYIDLLTSLKNRNYYNEKISVWNKNRIYPQTCIVMDINRVKELNDSFGHEEGDKQIQAVANILIRTQIDNSEIIRTDGNEFLVYLIEYSEKQVVSYIKKLMKEFKRLPHDYGVAIGYSMIFDDSKLIEDAFNEASEQMRENKDITEENV